MIYHKEIGFPAHFSAPVGRFVTVASRHALMRSEVKNFDLPKAIDLADFDFVEIEMSAGRLTKMVIRGEYDKYDDICLVIHIKNKVAFIRTAWLNAWDDNHRTLDPSKYAKP